MNRGLPVTETILIVDDNSVTRKLYCLSLESAGFLVVESTAKEAMEATSRANPALVVLDLIVPEAQGLNLARDLKDLPELEGVPIIAVSASGLVDAAKIAGVAFAEHLEKPVSPELLVQKVKTHLQSR